MTSLYEDHAWLYDLAFAWDLSDEVDLLLDRLGGVERVLEVACGSGRYLPELIARGVTPIGLDRSTVMLDRARRRLRRAGHPDVELVDADMTSFTLEAPADGAFCAVNTLGYLTTDEQVSDHLEAVATNLTAGGRYLVQLDLYPMDARAEDYAPQTWEIERGEAGVRCTWSLEELDPVDGLARYRSRIEVLRGPEEGRVVEHDHPMRAWTWADWSAAVVPSPLEQVAAHDGDADGWPALPLSELEAGAHLVWHELVAPTR